MTADIRYQIASRLRRSDHRNVVFGRIVAANVGGGFLVTIAGEKRRYPTADEAATAISLGVHNGNGAKVR